jgi:hypothetical protein
MHNWLNFPTVVNIGNGKSPISITERCTYFIQLLHHGGRSGSSAADLSERIGVARRNLETQFGGSSLIPGTPLSGLIP